MGWNISAAIIKPQVAEQDFLKILQSIGCKNIRFDSAVSFGYAVERDHENIYIGNYNGATILYDCIPLDTKREANGFTKSENALTALFPDRKMIVFFVVDSVPAYYIHIIDNGKTIRRRFSEDNDKQDAEEGEELLIEKKHYDSRILNENNVYVYTKTYERTTPDGKLVSKQDEFFDNEIGGEIAFDLCTDFIGHRWENLGEHPFMVHKFSEIQE